ncbi:DUF5060 domain-containing protein [Reichenbachiella sp. MALMAid0571]|uniref:DUF5060 domain-containing protein n=1 Tax=Reichenbachiella sp. MALMAid0571 TaxID=3143939 RepID=UPI0032DF7559
MIKLVRRFLFLMLIGQYAHSSASNNEIKGVSIGGELKKWHTVTLSFEGPDLAENSIDPSPFLDYRLLLTFTNGVDKFVVPGYFAADGNAAESHATNGNIWRVHFSPNKTGLWNYTASFRRGVNISVSNEFNAGKAELQINGLKGSFFVEDSNKSGVDFRSKGRLSYVGEHYLKFEETGKYFVKGGINSPENMLAYDDFDDTYDHGGQVTNYLHTYSPHVKHWKTGDPTWDGGKGKGLIGAVNYLSDIGLNAVYFLLQNVDGDGDDTWPWTTHEKTTEYDCSKLDQWEIVFEHMQKKGLMIQMVHQERENDHYLDNGNLGIQRKLYYRELIARFGHHPALVWNLGEETTNTKSQIAEFAAYIRSVDSYNHPIVIHTWPAKSEHDRVYNSLLGNPYFEGPSFQINGQGDLQAHDLLVEWIDKSKTANRKWIVNFDEINPHTTGLKPDSENPGHDDRRVYDLWAGYMAGAAGVEWYCGSESNLPDDIAGVSNRDRTLENFTTREDMWVQTRIAREFFENNIPLSEVSHSDHLVSKGLCLAKPGEIYTVYLTEGGSTELDLGSSNSTFSVKWFDPRKGGKLQNGTVTSITGPGQKSLGNPPFEKDKDWTILISGKPTGIQIRNFTTVPSLSLPIGQSVDISFYARVTDVEPGEIISVILDLRELGERNQIKMTKSGEYYIYKHTITLIDEGKRNVALTATDSDGNVVSSITPMFIEKISTPSYRVNVIGASGNKSFDPGENVQIEAKPIHKGKKFKKWIGDVSFLNDSTVLSPNFKMPARHLNFTAIYEPINQSEPKEYFEETKGMVILEAEDYHSKFALVPTNGTQKLNHDWSFEKKMDGYSGKGYMTNLPDEQCESCSGHNSPKNGSGAEMVYQVKINTDGVYKIWLLGKSLGGESNGVHIQIDNKFVMNSAGTNMSGFRPHKKWVWEHGHKNNVPEPKMYLSKGFHTIHVFGRDDGFSLDKIVLGIDQNDVPDENDRRQKVK